MRTILPIMLALVLLWPLQAIAEKAPPRNGVSVSASLGFADYRASEDGEEVASGQHFTQQYSLFYSYGQDLNGGRAGRVQLGLGYEFNAVDYTINGQGGSISTGKLLFRGQLMFAPGALPFRLTGFSQDVSASQFVASGAQTSPGSDPNSYIGETIFSPAIINDISNGSRVLTGLTLIAGIRNGSYLGRYRETLSHLPRLLVDYKQLDVNDTKTLTPERWRQRDLAFISLNKKDNWFHLRLRDYNNEIDPSSNYRERTITLGSIDNVMQRQWINLTNWIRLSADGNFSQYMPGNSDLGSTETFLVNLFGITQRQSIRTTTFANYMRETNDYWLSKELHVPFTVSGESSPDSAFAGRLEFNREMSTALIPQPQMSQTAFYEANDTEYFASTRFTTQRRQPKIITWLAEVERAESATEELSGVYLGVELASNSKFQSPTAYLVHYNVAVIQGESTFVENVLKGNVEKVYSPRLRAGIEETFIVGTGNVGSTLSSRISIQSQQGLSTQRGGNRQIADGTTLRSLLSGFVEASGSHGVSDRLSVAYDWLDAAGSGQSSLSIANAFSVQRRSLLVGLETAIVTGDSEGTTSGQRMGTIQTASTSGQTTLQLKNTMRLNYTPGRTWDFMSRLNHTLLQYEGGGSDARLDVAEEWNYHIYTVNGVVRKLAQIGEEFSYERYDQVVETWQTYSLTGKVEWYPKANLNLGTQLRYRYYSPQNVDQLTLISHLIMDYSKLKFGLYYSVGERSGNKEQAQRSEQRLDIKVNKVF